MSKFDASSGLSTKEIGIIKYNIKNQIAKQLPLLPDPVETKLFLQGRGAWLFGWRLLNDNLPVKLNDTISVEVTVKLKKEFQCYKITRHHSFSCKVQMQDDIYHPNLSVTRKTS